EDALVDLQRLDGVARGEHRSGEAFGGGEVRGVELVRPRVALHRLGAILAALADGAEGAEPREELGGLLRRRETGAEEIERPLGPLPILPLGPELVEPAGGVEVALVAAERLLEVADGPVPGTPAQGEGAGLEEALRLRLRLPRVGRLLQEILEEGVVVLLLPGQLLQGLDGGEMPRVEAAGLEEGRLGRARVEEGVAVDLPHAVVDRHRLGPLPRPRNLPLQEFERVGPVAALLVDGTEVGDGLLGALVQADGLPVGLLRPIDLLQLLLVELPEAGPDLHPLLHPLRLAGEEALVVLVDLRQAAPPLLGA